MLNVKKTLIYRQRRRSGVRIEGAGGRFARRCLLQQGTVEFFSERQHTCYSALHAIAHRPSVRLSVRPSHGHISQRRL